MEIRLTEEQQEIIKALKTSDKLKVNAYAGTGKTTTIKACAEAFQDKKILVLAFNRSVADELRSKLGNNCSVYTLHSLAYSLLGIAEYKDRLQSEKVFLDRLKELFDGEDFLTVKTYAKAFESYCNSEFTEINEENIVKLLFRNYDLRKKALGLIGKSVFKRSKKDLYKVAGELAERIEYIFYAIEKQAIPFTHSYYLKVFQLRLDNYINFFKKFYLLAVDEAQDINGVQEYVLKHAPVPKKLAVGDKHQQIYSWRLAINSLARLKDWDERYLTISFRFQDEIIPTYANAFLRNWKGESKLMNYKKSGRKTHTKAIISRTNSVLIRELADINEEVRFTRNINDIFKTVREAKQLLDYFYTGNENELKGLPNYVKQLAIEFKDIAQSVWDFASLFDSVGEEDYAFGIIIAERYDIEALYEKAKKLHNPNAKLTLSTAHSSKGLEFDKVKLTEDFQPLEEVVAKRLYQMLSITSEKKAEEVVKRIKEFDEEMSEVIDEINLYYVAWTRALYDIKGEGAINIMTSFQKVFDGKLLFEEIERLIGEQAKQLWAEQRKQKNK